MKKRIWLLLSAGLITAAGEMLGKILEAHADGAGMGIRSMLLSAILSGLAAAAVLVLILAAGWYIGSRFLFTGRGAKKAPVFFTSIRFFFISFAVIAAAWFPCWLAYYPANYSYDGEPQLIQYTTGVFNSHHPLLHTILLGRCYNLGVFLKAHGIPVDGMAVYSALQALFLAYAYASAVRFAAKRGASKAGVVTMLLWFALFPVHPVMAVTTTKDIFFTAFAVLFLLRLSDILIPASPDSDERKEMAGSRARILFFLQRVLLGFDGVMMTLFRKNGLYMMLLLLVFLVISAAAAAVSLKRGRKDSVCLSAMAVFLLVMILVYKGTDAYLIKITNAGKGEAAEALSLPLQQIARAYKSGGNSLKEDDLNDVEKYISEFGLNQYRPSISDGVKQYFNNEEYAENRSEFFKVWLRIGIESPGAYAAAFLYQTMGAWYPDDVSHLEVYRDWWRNRVCYIVTDAEPVFVAYDFVERDNFAPAVRSFYEAICTDCVYRKIPLVKYLFSPLLWCLGAFMLPIALLARKRKRAFLVSVPVFGELVMIFLGPCVISRYIYPFMGLLPVLSVLLLGEGRSSKEK
jgi:hypothetical protein